MTMHQLETAQKLLDWSISENALGFKLGINQQEWKHFVAITQFSTEYPGSLSIMKSELYCYFHCHINFSEDKAFPHWVMDFSFSVY